MKSSDIQPLPVRQAGLQGCLPDFTFPPIALGAMQIQVLRTYRLKETPIDHNESTLCGNTVFLILSLYFRWRCRNPDIKRSGTP